MDSLTLNLVSACTALVASILGPIVTLAVARRQFNANVLSANRQKWIETLRDTLAELISLMVSAAVLKAGWKERWNKGMDLIQSDPAYLAKLERIILIQWKIRLLLNPADADHRELYQTIDTALKRFQSEETQDAATEADIENITRLAQSILKREWQRVKLGT